ncbi:MAG: PQQ-binding-like beta-propeller repeat protein [Vicinamibacterales bacterium]
MPGIALIVLGLAGAVAAQQAASPAVTPQSGATPQEGGTVLGPPKPLPGTAMKIPEPPPDILWSAKILAAPVTSPLIAGEHVLLSYLPGIVAAHRRQDGQQVWQAELKPVQPLTADGDLLFVVAADAIHALRIADGTVVWRVAAGGLTAPLLAKDGWVIAATTGTLTARRASDGSEVWSVEAPLQREAAAIAGNALVVPTADGHVRSLNLTTGAETWATRVGGFPGEPLVVGDDVFLGVSDKYFYCLDADDGDIQWQKLVGATIRGRASTDGERVFFSALDNTVRALALGTGSQLWQAGLRFRPLAGPAAAGGTVFVSGPGAEVRMLRAKDGTSGGSVTFPGDLAIAPAMSAGPLGLTMAAATGGLDQTWSLEYTRIVRVPPPLTVKRPR